MAELYFIATISPPDHASSPCASLGYTAHQLQKLQHLTSHLLMHSVGLIRNLHQWHVWEDEGESSRVKV